MKSSTNELLRRLEQIQWFHNAGQPAQASDEVQFLEGWSNAVEFNASQTSKDARLEARNELTVRLSLHHRDADKEWNPKVIEIKPSVERLIAVKLASPEVAARIPGGASQAFIAAIRWDLLNLCMAYEYADLVPVSRYYRLLEHWYLAGHFPVVGSAKCLITWKALSKWAS